MIDFKEYKKNLTIDDIILIMINAGVEWYQLENGIIHFESICHNSKSHKLDYFCDSFSFYCYRDSENFDIFSLIQRVKKISFIDAFNYIQNIVKKNNINFLNNNNNIIDNWEQDLKFLLQNKTPQTLQIYDKNVMRLFDNLYWDKWVQEGISIESMQKFNIKWYQRCQSVVLPCYDLQGNLIGIRNRYTQDVDCEKGKYRPLITLNDEYKFPTSLSLWGLYQNKDAIKQSKSVILFESEKSILKLDGWGINNCAALYGGNLTVAQVNLLLTLGVENVILALDKQWIEMNKQDKGWVWWKNHILKAANKLQPYMNVEYMFDYDVLTETYDAPVDKGKEIWEKLYSERRKWK